MVDCAVVWVIPLSWRGGKKKKKQLNNKEIDVKFPFKLPFLFTAELP